MKAIIAKWTDGSFSIHGTASMGLFDCFTAIDCLGDPTLVEYKFLPKGEYELFREKYGIEYKHEDLFHMEMCIDPEDFEENSKSMSIDMKEIWEKSKSKKHICH